LIFGGFYLSRVKRHTSLRMIGPLNIETIDRDAHWEKVQYFHLHISPDLPTSHPTFYPHYKGYRLSTKTDPKEGFALIARLFAPYEIFRQERAFKGCMDYVLPHLTLHSPS
jgi:hypothetical protein